MIINKYELGVNGNKLFFNTDNRLFSPQGPDSGTLAMIKDISLNENDKVLDLGCGYGFVGIYLKSIYPEVRIDMVDNDPLAIEYAKTNIIENGMDLRVWLSDGLKSVFDNDYTLILSNPPYHTDFSVPKGFIEKGFEKLTVGGRMMMVVKRLLWYKNKMTSIFGGVIIKEVEDYYVLTSEKRSFKPPKKKAKPIKRKHKKRTERSK